MGHIKKEGNILAVGALIAIFSFIFNMGILFTDSAYGASYVNVSSNGSGDTAGVVSLGKIKPSSSGSTATGNDTLTVHTDCSAGYKVYVSGQNGKTTNLTNQSATDPTNPSSSDIISASSNTITSPNTLSSNTWGISGSSIDIENHLYAGLPTYEEALSTALITKTNVEEESTVPIYYGAKADTTLNPGTYSGDVLYTVLMDTSCIPYTVEFNPNVEDESEITGEMTPQSILPNSATTLTANAYERTGYAFLGWSDSANGKTGTATNGIGTEADVDYTNEQEVTNLATSGNTKTIYAIWIALDGNMQNFTGCSAMNSGDIVRLKDLRDNTIYTVKKFGDECWTTNNLVIGHDKGYALTNELTNIPDSDSSTYYIPQAGYQGNGVITEDSTNSTTAASFYGNAAEDKHAKVQYRAKGQGGDAYSVEGYTLAENTGYYNFYTATLGCSSYSDGNSGCVAGYTPRDICPKGWQLPNGGSNATKSWVSLDRAINGASAGSNRQDATARDQLFSEAGLFYSGYYYSQQLNGVGSYARLWSSKVEDTEFSSAIDLTATGFISPAGSSTKYSGYPVRCIVQNHYTISYDANSGAGTAPEPQNVTENGSITLQANTFTREGYNFLGWSTNASATIADYLANSAQNVNDLISAAATAGQTTTDGSTITLYAVWESAKVYFQATGSCATIDIDTTGTLTDARDEQSYTVYRFKNTGTAGNFSSGYPSGMAGYCIMTQDLSLGYVTGGSVTRGSNLTLTTNDSAAAATIIARTSDSDWSPTDSDSNNQYAIGPQSGYEAYTSHSYYSYGAAQKVCPKGWRPPTNSEYSNIISFMGGSSTTSSTNIRSAPYNFVYGGNFNNFTSGGFDSAGSYGDYWSSTPNGEGGYYLGFSSSSLYTLNRRKSIGRFVRCITAPPATTCFTAGTQIQTTMFGSTKSIEDIKIGDEVVSYDPDHNEYYMTEVLNTIVHDGEEQATKLAKLTLNNGAKLEMTLSHPILTTTGYKALQNEEYGALTKDDIIVTTTGEYGIADINIYDTEPTTVYNLTVKGKDGDTANGNTHSYIANGVVVHNKTVSGN